MTYTVSPLQLPAPLLSSSTSEPRRCTALPLHDACLCSSDVWICAEVGMPPTCFPVVNTPEQHLKNLFIAPLLSSQSGSDVIESSRVVEQLPCRDKNIWSMQGLRLRMTLRLARVSIGLKGVKVSHCNVLTSGHKT